MSSTTAQQVSIPAEPVGPYRAEFGAIHHEADAGYLFSIHPESAAKEVARAMNHAAAVEAALSAPTALVALDLYDPKVQQGIAWALGQVGAQLGAEDWAGGDGSESVEGDVADEIGNIMRAAGLVDADGEPLRRDTYRAPSRKPQSGALETVWRCAMTVACNIAIDEQNRTNEDDGPSDVLNAQGEIIRRLKGVLEIDRNYRSEVEAILSYGTEPFITAPTQEAALATREEAPAEAGERCWVLQRNDFPHAVYGTKEEADAVCSEERRKDRAWREENKHVADVTVFWNVYPAALRAQPQSSGEGGVPWRPVSEHDGSEESVLAICATAYSPTAFEAWFFDGAWWLYSRPGHKTSGGVGKWFPTHWMPKPALTTEGEDLRQALKHYACSCPPGICAMSADDTDVPVDEKMCGRRAAKALRQEGAA